MEGHSIGVLVGFVIGWLIGLFVIDWLSKKDLI
jgi:tetrahydromethanopterin S-methyltransferase subunit G